MTLIILTLNIIISGISFNNRAFTFIIKIYKKPDFYESIIRFAYCIPNLYLYFCYNLDTSSVKKEGENL